MNAFDDDNDDRRFRMGYHHGMSSIPTIVQNGSLGAALALRQKRKERAFRSKWTWWFRLLRMDRWFGPWAVQKLNGSGAQKGLDIRLRRAPLSPFGDCGCGPHQTNGHEVNGHRTNGGHAAPKPATAFPFRTTFDPEAGDTNGSRSGPARRLSVTRPNRTNGDPVQRLNGNAAPALVGREVGASIRPSCSTRRKKRRRSRSKKPGGQMPR